MESWKSYARGACTAFFREISVWMIIIGSPLETARMTKLSLESIASARAKLQQELQALEQQESQLREEATTAAFEQVRSILAEFASHFSARQKAELTSMVAVAAPGRGVSKSEKREVAPKYWLPHTQETWSGRGRTPRNFAAWEGTAAYKEWKSRHPDEKFPKFPG